jgi:DNA repair protein RecN (Recombination protein N)
MRDLSSRLVELHGQHEHQTLLDPGSHLDVVDAYGGLQPAAAPVSAAFDRWQASGAELARVRKAIAERQTRQEFVAFQLAELDRAGLKPMPSGSAYKRVRRVEWARPAERVQRLCEESYAALYESDGAVLAGLGAVWRRVSDLAALDRRFEPFLTERDGIKSQLEELAAFLRHYGASIEASPERLQQIEERLSLLERLKKKHGPTLRDCIARRDALRQELSDLERGDERIAELERSTPPPVSSTCRPHARSRPPGRRLRARSVKTSNAWRRSWRWSARGSKRDSPRTPTCWRRIGPRAGSIAPSSTSRPIPAKTCGRWRGSSRAVSCRVSCWPSRR